MRKGIIASLALSSLLLTGPAALAAPAADPVGSLPGHGLMHAGHDHGDDKADKPKPKPKKSKDKYENKGKKKGKAKSSGAHASGGYDHHRSHSR
jgi:hypothetical protein